MIILLLILIVVTLLLGAAAVRGFLVAVALKIAAFCGLLTVGVLAIYLAGEDGIFWLCGLGMLLAIFVAILQAKERERQRNPHKPGSNRNIWDGHIYAERETRDRPKSYIPGHNDRDWTG